MRLAQIHIHWVLSMHSGAGKPGNETGTDTTKYIHWVLPMHSGAGKPGNETGTDTHTLGTSHAFRSREAWECMRLHRYH